MKTLVIQSFRSQNVPALVERCLGSVKVWTAARGFDYELVGDESFALCGADYLARVDHDVSAITNLSRLELVRGAHRKGYERAIWIDANVLVFHPECLTIDIDDRYAFARGTWVKPVRDQLIAEPGVNNSVFVCMKDEPDLNLLISITRHVAQNRAIQNSSQVGDDLVRGLRASLDFEVLDDIGTFSPHTVAALADEDEEVLSKQAIGHATPVFAAKLCASERGAPSVPEAKAMTAIDRLVETKGSVVNDWLTQSPNNLISGKPNVGMAKLFPLEVNVSLQFQQGHGYPPNLANPQSRSEFIARAKLAEDQTLKTLTADKVAVRDFVAARIGKDTLIPLLQVCEHADDLQLDALPNSFILKSAHASGWNQVVWDKQTANADALRQKMRKWLRSNFWTTGFEPHYRDIQPRVIVEQLLVPNAEAIMHDYKFHVLNGVVRFIEVVIGRFQTPTQAFFDPAWRRLNVKHTSPPIVGNCDPPPCFRQMLAFAEILAKGFEQVRVDLYCIDRKVYFGELTHTPGAGTIPYHPVEFDFALGQILREGGAIPERFYAPRPPPSPLAPRRHQGWAKWPTPV